MSRSLKHGRKGRGGDRGRGGSGSGTQGGRHRDPDDISASLDAAVAGVTRYFQSQDEEDELRYAQRERDADQSVRREREQEPARRDGGSARSRDSGSAAPAHPVDLSKRLEKQSTRTARSLFRAASGSPARKRAGCTEEEAAVWIARIERAESKYRWQEGAAGEKGWIRWDDFHRDFPDLRPVRQLLRELHLAWKNVGTQLLRRALVALGPTKAARFLRLRVSTKRLEKMLDRGVILHPGEAPVDVASLTQNQIRTLVRLEAGERDTAEGGREFRWPESLINHTRALLADWPAINEAPKGFKSYRERNLRPSVRAEHRRFMLELLRVLEMALPRVRKWLDDGEDT